MGKSGIAIGQLSGWVTYMFIILLYIKVTRAQIFFGCSFGFDVGVVWTKLKVFLRESGGWFSAKMGGNLGKCREGLEAICSEKKSW